MFFDTYDANIQIHVRNEIWPKTTNETSILQNEQCGNDKHEGSKQIRIRNHDDNENPNMDSQTRTSPAIFAQPEYKTVSIQVNSVHLKPKNRNRSQGEEAETSLFLDYRSGGFWVGVAGSA